MMPIKKGQKGKPMDNELLSAVNDMIERLEV